MKKYHHVCYFQNDELKSAAIDESPFTWRNKKIAENKQEIEDEIELDFHESLSCAEYLDIEEIEINIISWREISKLDYMEFNKSLHPA